MGRKWLVNQFLQITVVPWGNTRQIYRRSLVEAFCLVVKLCLTTFYSFRVPSQSSLGIAAHLEPRTIPTLCFYPGLTCPTQPLPTPPPKKNRVIDFP